MGRNDARPEGTSSGRRIWVSNRQRRVKVDRERVRRVADFVLERLGLDEVELSVVLVSDRRIHQLNRAYLGRDRPTDVLAFSQWDGGRLVPPCLGDVVISVERTAEQAAGRGVPLERELDLLLVHGILHLLGHDHTAGGAEAARMRRRERRLASLIGEQFGPGGEARGAGGKSKTG